MQIMDARKIVVKPDMLDYFKEFQVLAVHLNFTTAANELGMSQSCLSRHINELEREVGFTLFERNPVRLTAVGQKYLTGVGQALSQIDKITQDCRQLAKMGPQKLSIATILAKDVANTAMYASLSQLHDKYPNFEHRFVNNRKLTIRKTVEAGEADVGILCHEPENLDPSLQLEWLFDNPFGAIMRKDDPLIGKPIHIADLSSHSVVLSANRQFTTWLEGMQAACKQYGCHPQFKMKDAETIEDFLISMQPGEVVFARTDTFHPEATNPNLVAVDFADDERLTYPTFLLYKKESAQPIVAEFVQLMRDQAAKLRSEGLVF